MEHDLWTCFTHKADEHLLGRRCFGLDLWVYFLGIFLADPMADPNKSRNSRRLVKTNKKTLELLKLQAKTKMLFALNHRSKDQNLNCRFS